MSGDMEMFFEPAAFGRALKDLRAFDKELAKQTRAELRRVAQPAVNEVRQAIMSIPSKGNSPTGVRRTLAAGTKASIRTGGKSTGVSIRTSGAKLPYPRMAQLLNESSWRHPVFGDRRTWVTQQGRPYFGVVLNPKVDLMREGIGRALQAAVEQIH